MARSSIRAVLFDLDGTLVGTMQSAPGVSVAAIEALSGRRVTTRDVVDVWHIGPTPVVLEHFTGRPATGDVLDTFYGFFAAASRHTRPFPGIVSLLDASPHEASRSA